MRIFSGLPAHLVALFLLFCLFFSPLGMQRIQAQEPLRMVYFDNFPPYSFKNETGQMQGILIDIVNAALREKMAITVTHEGMPWARAQTLVKDGMADGFITVPNPERKTYTYVSEEVVLSTTLSVFANKFNPKIDDIMRIRSIADLAPFVILDYNGNGWGDANLQGFNRLMISNFDHVFHILAENRGDVVLRDSFVGKDIIEKNDLTDKLVQVDVDISSVAFHLCLGQASNYVNILAEFDQTIAAMKANGELDEILNRYR